MTYIGHGQNRYKVKFSGICCIPMKSSKKNSIGWWRTVGNRYTDTQVVCMTFAEPSDEVFMQAVQLTNPHLKIDKVEWEFIGTFESETATQISNVNLIEVNGELIRNPALQLNLNNK